MHIVFDEYRAGRRLWTKAARMFAKLLAAAILFATPRIGGRAGFLAPLKKLLDLLFELLDALAQRDILRQQPGDFRFQLGDPSISIIHDPINVTENPISGKRKCLTVTHVLQNPSRMLPPLREHVKNHHQR